MVIATAEDLESYLGRAVTDANRLLLRAQELIYQTLSFPVDENDEDQVKVIKQAQCAQVEFWLQVDESVDIVGPPSKMQMPSDFIVDVNLTTVAPRAKRLLIASGFISRKAGMGRRHSLRDIFFSPYDNKIK